jgi:hypothetical protein
MILLISASQVAKIAGVSHHNVPRVSFPYYSKTHHTYWLVVTGLNKTQKLQVYILDLQCTVT